MENEGHNKKENENKGAPTYDVHYQTDLGFQEILKIYDNPYRVRPRSALQETEGN